MTEVCDLFEVHLAVRDLDEAVRFYRDVLGLQLAHVTADGESAFCWIGSPGNAMLGLWATRAAPLGVTSHTAFRVPLPDVEAAPGVLRSAGITPLDFDGAPTDFPVVLAWMPAAAIYFRDPTGNLLEFIAMLPQEPQPDLGVVTWRVWQRINGASAAPPVRHRTRDAWPPDGLDRDPDGSRRR